MSRKIGIQKLVTGHRLIFILFELRLRCTKKSFKICNCWAADHLGWILISSGGVEVFEVGQDYYGQDYYIIIVQDTLLLQYYYYCIGLQFTAAAAAHLSSL
jgi:hypothetical protein